MKSFTVGKNDAGQRLDRWLAKSLPLLPAPLAQKYLRLKRVKLNGKAARRDARLAEGDLLELYLNDEFFDQPREDNAFLAVYRPRLDVVYEDENLLLLNKRPGLLCHPDEREKVNTLLTQLQAYLYQKREWSPRQERSFAPALCNRIDRNTGGLVLAAKNAETLRILNQKIRDREIDKYYLAVVHGRMQPAAGQLEGVLLKDEARAQVKVYHRSVPGGRSAATRYRTLAYRDGLSLVECQLLTGRTHQIRAQFADAGHPLLGDGKYGRQRDNKQYGRSYQALYSYKLVFSFPTPAGMLEYLRGRTFAVEQVEFVSDYFPELAP